MTHMFPIEYSGLEALYSESIQSMIHDVFIQG